jgi:hypothetical protein
MVTFTSTPPPRLHRPHWQRQPARPNGARGHEVIATAVCGMLRVLASSLRSRGAVTGGAQHQVDQGVAAAGIHRSLVTGRSGAASVLIQYREYAYSASAAGR